MYLPDVIPFKDLKLQCLISSVSFNMKHHLSHYLLNEVLKSGFITLKLRTTKFMIHSNPLLLYKMLH